MSYGPSIGEARWAAGGAETHDGGRCAGKRAGFSPKTGGKCNYCAETYWTLKYCLWQGADMALEAGWEPVGRRGVRMRCASCELRVEELAARRRALSGLRGDRNWWRTLQRQTRAKLAAARERIKQLETEPVRQELAAVRERIVAEAEAVIATMRNPETYARIERESERRRSNSGTRAPVPEGPA